MPRIGVLTGGGDAPGLNAAIRAIVRTAATHKIDVLGIRLGWKGLLTNDTMPLTLDRIDELLYRGGTVLGTSRTNPYKEKDGPGQVRKTLASNHLDALIAMGGEDTIGVAAKLFAEGLPIVGVPKTIDNDLDATQFTIGFHTALDIVTEAMDRLRTTAESHDRVMIVEIMGRHAGWLAAYAGIAGGADAVLVPEFPTKLQDLCNILRKCRDRGKNYCLIAVAEGAEVIGENGEKISSQSEAPVDAFGHVQLGGIADRLKDLVKKKTGYDTRSTILGHVQRGGSPTAFDRILATAFGVRAVELVKKKEFGKMPALVGGQITAVPLSDAVARLKTLTPEVYQLAQVFFG
ncbi:MAG TPA: ATP-dependent 6-phosphofructokinase [Bdellovibrionota bacterium]|nr:ATP-dependent 6-phosphofructokinase [Bdellovibrionota bacterium]